MHSDAHGTHDAGGFVSSAFEAQHPDISDLLHNAVNKSAKKWKLVTEDRFMDLVVKERPREAVFWTDQMV